MTFTRAILDLSGAGGRGFGPHHSDLLADSSFSRSSSGRGKRAENPAVLEPRRLRRPQTAPIDARPHRGGLAGMVCEAGFFRGRDGGF